MAQRSLFRPQAVMAAMGEHSSVSLPVAPLSWKILGGFVLASVTVVVFFLATAEYARKETAGGSLVAAGGAVRVSALRGGVVTELAVKEGDRVAAGQPLFTVTSRQGLEAGGTLDAAVLASLDTQTQVLKDQIAADPARMANEIRRLDATIVSVTAERDALIAQRRIMAERVQVTEERRGTIARLTEQGHTTRATLQEQDEALLSRRQNLAEIDRDLAASEKELGQAQLQREQLPVQQAERLAQLRLNLADRERQRAEVQAQRAQVITAPLAGRVTALQVAPGQIVDVNKPLLTLLPDGAVLLAELFVPSRAIGFVEPGQPVRLMVDAFPYQRFGTLSGSVETVSQAVLSPSEIIGRTTLTEPAYRVSVRLDRQAIDAFGREVPLQPDMTLKADIVLEGRSLVAWLFEPLISVRGRM
ncbi:HlyD family efflux transporter periplasmic adaptor subunit [Microvirga sp. CF3062]|uniref:HlyD family secretion protein n=1 Tax=Microvirga sp. CF3062 TaxID=3110182 RepID=UPI002E788B2D|nr:HlyD family efflux transporter periplasmic adaptor subunit [Microvirga sp. CF3062]MEE1655182.1 HlyD family efflux transporter periplasmic adaptor subunit [Microvirga sp. CF3062]